MNMRLTALVATAIIFSALSGYGVYSLNAMGIITPPTPATAEAIECERFGRANKNFPAQYDRVASQAPYNEKGELTGGCKGFIKMHREAYPDMPPVPLKLETAEASNTQGKP
jgi:hypothetical protein